MGPVLWARLPAPAPGTVHSSLIGAGRREHVVSIKAILPPVTVGKCFSPNETTQLDPLAVLREGRVKQGLDSCP